MTERLAADLFVECLENEDVEYVFGIPGEETLELNRALAASEQITFVPVRHEQGGAFMANMVGRLTGQAGVCLGTLGPGAMNLVMAVGDAFLDRAPLVALTGQADLERMHKESHQYIDLVEMLKPVTKWNALVTSPDIIPEVVRKAFKVAEAEKPGATHLELPEDVMGTALNGRDDDGGSVSAEAGSAPLPRVTSVQPEPAASELERAAKMIREAEQPIALAGNGVARVGAAAALRAFCAATGIGVAETFMGKGVVESGSEHALGTVGLRGADYELAGFDDADLVLAIGYDLVEHGPQHWNPSGDKRIIVIDSLPAEVDAHYVPEVELVGDIGGILARLTSECRGAVKGRSGSPRLRELIAAQLDGARDDDRFPMRPTRLIAEIRDALDADDILISDVGLHKLWIARLYGAQQPNTVMIANGLAGMGFALPCAIGAKLVRRDHKVVTVSGDGGFMMNVQELETAKRLGLPIVNVLWENRQFGSIVWKQDTAFGEHFGVDFTNPDFVKLAEAFGLPAWRCEGPDEFRTRLDEALALDESSLIVVPVDYEVDVATLEE